jgi:8-oxo-dGTP pyrophosphatase MutT (NUDIX family)
MIVKRETIFDNKWVSLMKSTEDNGCQYIYSSEPWCDSQGVAVLVYRYEPKGKDLGSMFGLPHAQREYLGRFEVCPAHSDVPELCAITGGMDKPDEDAFATAIREVKEEAGFDVTEQKMLYLGSVRPSKASDKTVHLMAFDVTGLEQGEAVGDGTLGEVGAFTEWVTRREAAFSKDPVLTTMITRLDMLIL